jgi:hypothetical protein
MERIIRATASVSLATASACSIDVYHPNVKNGLVTFSDFIIGLRYSLPSHALICGQSRKLRRSYQGLQKDFDSVQYQLLCEQLSTIVIQTMNHYFCVLDGSSKVLFIETLYAQRGNTWTPDDSILRTRAEFLERLELFNLDILTIGNLEKLWCRSSARKTLNKVVFETNPCVASSNNYNLFYGFPFPYDVQKTVDMTKIAPLLNHVHEVLANNNPTIAEYILDWLAHLV